MKLPFADQAVIPPEKVRDYLLSPVHPFGLHKAIVFAKVGYSQSDWMVLKRDLELLARTGDAEERPRIAHGQKFVIRGILQGPNGRALAVATVWIVPDGKQYPRLVTAYPGRAG